VHAKGCIGIGDWDIEMTKSLDIKNPDFMKHEITSESGPSDPEMIRTIDFFHIGDSRHQASGLPGLETLKRSRAVHLEGCVEKDQGSSTLCPSGNQRSR
jgi:hypothetical protein